MGSVMGILLFLICLAAAGVLMKAIGKVIGVVLYVVIVAAAVLTVVSVVF